MMISKRDHRTYLQDILSAIERIQEYTAGGRDEFFGMVLIQDAVIRQLSIIGEATAKLPAALKATQPDIPWKHIVGMRNIIVHDYSDTDLPVIWDSVVQGLPPLQKAVETMLRKKAA